MQVVILTRRLINKYFGKISLVLYYKLKETWLNRTKSSMQRQHLKIWERGGYGCDVMSAAGSNLQKLQNFSRSPNLSTTIFDSIKPRVIAFTQSPLKMSVENLKFKIEI